MLSINGSGTAAGSESPAPAKGGGAVPPASDRADMKQARFAQAFSGIVAVLMRDANYRDLKISALEHLVVPAVLSGQWSLAHAPASNSAGRSSVAADKVPMVPVATALWARVSDEVDRKLSEGLDKRLLLQTGEWCSGSNVWLIAMAGGKDALPKLIRQLREEYFKDKRVKLFARDGEGKPFTTTLDKIVPSGRSL